MNGDFYLTYNRPGSCILFWSKSVELPPRGAMSPYCDPIKSVGTSYANTKTYMQRIVAPGLCATTATCQTTATGAMRSSAVQSDSPCDSPCVAPLHTCTQCASCTQLISVLASTLGADEVRLIATAAHVPPLGLQISAHGVCYVTNALLVHDIHAAAAAAARACAIAMKKYCFRRLADDYIVRATDDAPTPVPWPM